MLRIAFAGALALAALLVSGQGAEARFRSPSVPICDPGEGWADCQAQIARPRARHAGRGSLKRSGRGFVAAPARAHTRASVASTGGLVTPLASKVAEITGSCQSRLVSAVRHTRIAGTRLISLHASGRAADLAGDPACIYRHLAGWQGGYSVDYARVRHVHISWDPDGRREWGVRFAHGVHRRHARRHRLALR